MINHRKHRQGHHSKGSKRLVFHIISWVKLSPVSYSRSMRGSRLHITFTQHRFQDWSVQVFLSGRNEFVYWAKVGHATHTCWKHWHSKEPVFICFKNPPSVHYYSSSYNKTWVRSKIGKHADYCTFFVEYFLFKKKISVKQRNDHLLPRWRPIKAKVLASLTVLSPCLQCFSAEPLPGGKMCDAVSQNDFREVAQA